MNERLAQTLLTKPQPAAKVNTAVATGALINSSNTYRRDIDGLRAIAVTAVICFHAGLFPFRSGFVGVDVFFVISGFLIGGSVYQDAVAGRFDFAHFYARRAKRILPALITVTLTTLALGLVLMGPIELRHFGISAVTALLGVSNLRFFHYAGDYFSSNANLDPLLMTWSLGVEEQFYAFFPIILICLHRLFPRNTFWSIATLSIASLGLSIFLTHKDPNQAFYLVPARAWELGVGALVAIWRTNRQDSLTGASTELAGGVGLTAIAASLMVFSPHTPFPGAAALLPVLGTALMITSENSTINKRLLSASPMVGLGAISYSWYLWHWPLMAFVRVCSAEPPSVEVLLGVALTSLGIAYLSWRFIEKPFRQTSDPDRLILFRFALTLAACMVLAVSLDVGHGFPKRVAVRVRTIESGFDAFRENPCLNGGGPAGPNLSADCVTPDGRQRLALLGDSHAAALSIALRELGAQHGLGFEEFTKSSCPLLVAATRRLPLYPGAAQECAKFDRESVDAVVNDRRVRIVVLAAYWSAPFESDNAGDAYIGTTENEQRLSSADELRAALMRTERTFQRAGKTVIVFGDVPRLNFDPTKEMITDALPWRKQVQRLVNPEFMPVRGVAGILSAAPAQEASLAVIEAAQVVSGVTYLPLHDAICNAKGCRFSDGESPFYVDGNHLSYAGARFCLASFASRLRAVLAIQARARPIAND